MNKLLSALSLILFLGISLNTYSQLTLIGLGENPVIKKHLINNPVSKNSKSKSASDTLELPFIDDFSNSYIYPDSSLWLDKYAFINSSYAIMPPSIGVATLDAIDFDGSVYEKASRSIFEADTLTSKPINLYFPEDSTIFFSFFYQPQGIADRPEENDSLVLEFYSPIDTIWHHAWSTTGTSSHDFKQIILPVNDSVFLQKGFQFRFRNYASISSTINDNIEGNVDQWHLDYIHLNKNRSINDTILRDVAIIYPGLSLLKEYENIPWKHYQSVGSSLLVNKTKYIYINNDDRERNVSQYTDIYDQNDNLIFNVSPPTQTNANPFDIITNETEVDLNLTTSELDSAQFKAVYYIESNKSDFIRSNDTTRYFQNFYNYYAYDDGTAEYGFGINGEGTKNASLAYKFNNYKTDTLQAVQMYFNQYLHNDYPPYFFLSIWKDNNGKPGDTLYTQIGARPDYSGGLNGFQTIELEKDLTIPAGTFYVGWTKTTEDMLNIGFDKNRNAKDKIFYKIGEEWLNAPDYDNSFNGALMIRPVFGKPLPLSTSNIEIAKENEFIVYPNPVSDRLYIDTPYNSFDDTEIYIFDNYGRLVKNITLAENSIDVSTLSKGVYMLKIIDSNKFTTTKKIVVIH